jgi:hypothetical protein
MNPEKKKLAKTIDNWVNGIIQSSSSEEQIAEHILKNMYDYMPLFKQLMESCSSMEMDMLASKYSGFSRFALFLERVAQGIQDGAIKKKKRPVKPKRKRK